MSIVPTFRFSRGGQNVLEVLFMEGTWWDQRVPVFWQIEVSPKLEYKRWFLSRTTAAGPTEKWMRVTLVEVFLSRDTSKFDAHIDATHTLPNKTNSSPNRQSFTSNITSGPPGGSSEWNATFNSVMRRNRRSISVCCSACVFGYCMFYIITD